MGNQVKAADILALPVDERLRLVEEIWDSLAAEPSPVPVPDWHRAELDERLSRHDADPDAAEPWDQVLAELAGKRSRP